MTWIKGVIGILSEDPVLFENSLGIFEYIDMLQLNDRRSCLLRMLLYSSNRKVIGEQICLII